MTENRSPGALPILPLSELTSLRTFCERYGKLSLVCMKLGIQCSFIVIILSESEVYVLDTSNSNVDTVTKIKKKCCKPFFPTHSLMPLHFKS